MSVKIKAVFLGRASEIVGKYTVELEFEKEPTLLELIKAIGDRVSKRFYERYVNGHYVYVAVVNGKPVDNPNYKLSSGDRVVFVTPEMGG
ncbi:MAG: MoaD/ThiS family protein [Thermoprotei archaeon]